VVKDYKGRLIATMAHASYTYGFIETTIMSDNHEYFYEHISRTRNTTE